MTSIDNIILKSTNPFDSFRSVNFWQPQQIAEPVVESIHQGAIAKLEEVLDLVIQDRRTRTVLLQGDPGSGKTYLLGRVKQSFNNKAFFAYINPFPQSDRIWQHVLRYTVDSMVQVPEGQQDSQLMLWIKSLSALTQRSLKQRIFDDNFWEVLTSDRKKFIKHLKETYKKSNIYNADNFFGAIYDLTKPELYDSACQWLRGDDLSEESLQELGIKSLIDSEEAAYETLSNFGKISTETQPIVLCFDQIQSVARLPDGTLDLTSLLTVNSKIHDENSNFLIVLSITTSTWSQYRDKIEQCHKDRIDTEIYLKRISLQEAESILSSRLAPLHNQANPKPISSIYPLNSQHLSKEFNKRFFPREVLIFGRDIFQDYKKWLASGKKGGDFNPSKFENRVPNNQSELLAYFKLKWADEFTKVQNRIKQVRQQSSPELIQMLKEALIALQAEEVQIPLLTGTKFASYSLSYRIPNKPERIGVVWTEEQNMASFYYVMEACRKTIVQKTCQTLYLIREEDLAKRTNKGYKTYSQLFNGKPHQHIAPKLASVHYLVTYYDLVKDAREGDLVVMGETLGVKQLQKLIGECEFFQNCPLLKYLGVVVGVDNEIAASKNENVDFQPIKEFMLNLVITQQFLGRQALVQNAVNKFSDRALDETKANQLIDELCQVKKVQILDPSAKLEAQLICLVPQK